MKIERAFINGTPANTGDVAIVADSVENREQFNLLKAKRCDPIQGYHFGRPLSAEDFTAYYREHL